MKSKVTFEHKVLESGQHAITSPEIKGFCIVADDRQQAFDQADAMLDLMRSKGLVKL